MPPPPAGTAAAAAANDVHRCAAADILTLPFPPPCRRRTNNAAIFCLEMGQGGGGVSSACFAHSALLALIHVGGVFRVVRWQGNWWQYWGIGGSVLALGHHWLRITRYFAAWRWGGRVGGVVLMRRRWWRVGWAGEL